MLAYQRVNWGLVSIWVYQYHIGGEFHSDLVWKIHHIFIHHHLGSLKHVETL